MSRNLRDANLLEWEVFASAGDFGMPDRAYIVFNCLSDRRLRPRYVRQEGDKAEAEALVAGIAEPELEALFSQSVELD